MWGRGPEAKALLSHYLVLFGCELGLRHILGRIFIPVPSWVPARGEVLKTLDIN